MMERARITLFTQAGCAESAHTRDWLRQRGLTFRERNVIQDSDAMQALATTGIFATPLLVIGDQKILGFRPQVIESALEDNGFA